MIKIICAMEQNLVACVVIGVIASLIGGTEAVTCYSCDSTKSSACLDPFTPSGVDTCNGASCTKARASGSGVTVVIRGCEADPVDMDLCGDFTVSGIKSKGCVCRTDRCNDGQMVKPTIYNVIAGVAMATVVSIAWMNQI